jgi:hypothetical protein
MKRTAGLPAEAAGSRDATATRRFGALLWAGAGLALVAAGLLLWADRGARVFTDMLSAAFAWCF